MNELQNKEIKNSFPLTSGLTPENNDIFYNTKITSFGSECELKYYSHSIHRKTNQSIFDDSESSSLRAIYKNAPSDEKRSIENSRKRTIQSIYNIARSNDWEWFVTFTFDPQKINSSDFDTVSSVLNDWLSNMRKRYCSDLRYLLVPELHKDGLKYHFHGVFSDIGNLTMIDSGITQNNIKIYNLLQYRLGFSTCSIVQDSKRVSSYITKYITKELCFHTKFKKRYWSSRNLNKPEEYFLNIPRDELDMMLNSFGEVKHSKSIDVDVSHNHVDIFQISTI